VGILRPTTLASLLKSSASDAGETVDINKLIQAYGADNSYTPDLRKLRGEYSYVPLFVYDTLKYGFSEHWRLKDFPRLGIGATTSDEWRMFKTEEDQAVVLNKPPVVMPPRNGHIFGDLFAIPVSLLVDIDNYITNTVFFHRENVMVRWRAKGDDRTYISPAMMYVGDLDCWKHKLGTYELASLPIRTPQTGPNRPYYLYGPEDDARNREDKALVEQTTKYIMDQFGGEDAGRTSAYD
jgi:gamma-glutamylcyclotransferase (GGCT)/AIG2-like uncharacterized protein YtfP